MARASGVPPQSHRAYGSSLPLVSIGRLAHVRAGDGVFKIFQKGDVADRMKEHIYNKLVRDNVPDIIREQGGTPVIRTLGDEEYV